MTHRILLVSIVLYLVSSFGQSIPPQGLYITLSNSALTAIFSDVGLQVADYANSDTTTPDVSGSTSSITYTLKNFVYDIDIEAPSFSLVNANTMQLTYSIFNFIIQMDYHIKSNSLPVTEDGVIQLFTVGSSSSLSIDVLLDFSGPTVFFNATSVVLNIPQNSAQIYVDCTNTFCLIPTGDIANGVAQAFPGAFQSTLEQALDSAFSQYLNGILTTLSFPALGINAVLTGGFTFAGGPANFVSYAAGEFEPDNSITPPFTPTFTPPMSVFTNPAGETDFIFTEYMIETAVWALNINGDFNKTITNADVPPDSPFHLVTNDPFFDGAIPELKKLSSVMDIVISTSLYNLSDVTLSAANGILTSTSALAQFNLVNSTSNIEGWILMITVGADMTADVAMNGTELAISFTPSNFQIQVSVVSSNFGAISTDEFHVLIKIALAALLHPPYTVNIPTPQYFELSSPFVNIYDGYGDIGANVQYSTSPSVIVCGGSDQVCPSQNTCCQWSSGWGCCVLPNATCCDNGCCFEGVGCQDEACFNNN